MRIHFIAVLLALAAWVVPGARAESDAAGKDHPNIPRFPGTVIVEAIQHDFGAHEFTLKDGALLSERDVLRHCAKYLEDVMIPKVVEFRETMPRNDAGKIDKRRLIAGEDR